MAVPDYQRLFESTPALTVVLDRQFRIVAASDAYLRATMTQRADILGRDVFEVFPGGPPDAQARGTEVVRSTLRRVLAQGCEQTLALQRYDLWRSQPPEPMFERRYWNGLFTPVRGENGEVAYISCVVQDVSDRAREAHLHRVLNVDAIGVLFFDSDGTVISANDTFLRWSGYTREDVTAGSLSWQALTPAEHHAISRTELERLHATGRIGPYEKEYFTKDGGRRWMLFVGARLDDGTVVEYVLDVSARKAAEQSRRESEERYRTLLNSIDAGFCVIEMLYDADGRPQDYRFLEVNPAFGRLTGLRDATRKTMREHAPDLEQHWFDTFAQIAETGEPVRLVQETKALMSGWYEVFAFRMGGEGSRQVGVLFTDITQRVRAQRALTEEGRRKDEFLATLAHELRNPLAPIRNAVSILQLRHGGDESLRSVGELVDRQVRHLVRLVDDLLDVSRITFGKVQLRRERVDLRDVAQEAVAISEPALTGASQVVELHLGDAPAWVDADRVRLAQVISNLLNNAARYTPSSGTITLTIGRDGAEAWIEVRDNGIGIDPELLQRIFEPFMQVEHAGGSGGIGIGLALAKALIELHGGRISAQSAGLGQGSRFVVRLPRASAPEPVEAARGASPRKKPRRLLLVDDNVDATVSQAELLRELGHEVETAFNGPSALEKAQHFKPEVVLLDIGMPGMDGYEVARRLRASPRGLGLVIVAQTGWGQEEDRRRSREAGFDHHLAKPVGLDELMQYI